MDESVLIPIRVVIVGAPVPTSCSWTCGARHGSGLTPAQGTLSEREVEILQRVASGSSTREVADQPGISTNTVKTHVEPRCRGR